MSEAIRTLPVMSETLIGYTRCSTDAQDLTAQRDRLSELGVPEQRIYLDHGLTGTNRPQAHCGRTGRSRATRRSPQMTS